MDDQGVYAGLALIRRRKRRMWLLLPFSFVWFALSGFVLAFLDVRNQWVFFFVLYAGVFLFLVAYVRVQFSRCPRCGKFYHFCWFYGNVWWCRGCFHCGLPLKTSWEATEQGRALIRAWLDHPPPRPPIPKVGLRCSECGYLLTGLTVQRCPECGHKFRVSSLTGVKSVCKNP